MNNATNVAISGNLDAAFVPYEEYLFSFSNTTLYGKAVLSKTIGSYVEGTQVKCEGASSATIKGGAVKKASTTVRAMLLVGDKETEVVFTDFIQTTMDAVDGDSGGICYLSSSLKDGSHAPIGIISCANSNTYMCKISNINSSFSLSMN